MKPEDFITSLIIGIAILILVLFIIFLLIRELICWYYKINHRIKLQEETNRLLRIIAGESKPNIIEGKVNITDLKSLNLAKERGEISQEEYLKLMKQNHY